MTENLPPEGFGGFTGAMVRFTGQALPESPRIAVISNDAIGNFVIATPLLQMLKAQYPSATLEYFAGTRVNQFLRASGTEALFDQAYPLHGTSAAEAFATVSLGSFDFVFNMESTTFSKVVAAALVKQDGFLAGPCLDGEGRGDLAYGDDDRGDLWRDRRWIDEEITVRYPFLTTGWIGEMFCRLAYLNGPIPAYSVPSADPGREVPDVLIATSASLPEKLWPVEKWLAVLPQLGVSVGLIGAPARDQGRYWKGASLEDDLVAAGAVQDLRGQFSLPEVVGALGRARAVLSLDNGILHLAAAAGAPTVGLFRHGIHRLWAPPFDALTILTPGSEERSVAEIDVEVVADAMRNALS